MSILNLAARTWSRWAAAISVFVLVATALSAGVRYVVCARTGGTHLHACCAQRHAKISTKKGSPPRRADEFVSARSCCEPHQVRASGAAATTQHAAPSLEVSSATLPQEAWTVRPGLAAARVCPGEQWPIRAGPSGHGERLAQLQVFLI